MENKLHFKMRNHFTNTLILSVLCTVICFFSTASSQIQAQDQRPLYLLTWNNSTRLSSIWEYEIGDPQATRVFTLQPTKRKNGELFSSHELEALRSYVKDYQLEASWGEGYSPIQTISIIWQLDVQHLLIQTTNDLQNGLGRAADNNASGRFGYYEFLILDLTNQQLTSIFTLDYHDPINNDWRDTLSIPFIQIARVQINPTQDQLALMLTPTHRWMSIFSASILIVDYSTLPAKVTHLPLANSPVWSPDGRRLAYWQVDCDCENNEDTHSSLALQVFEPSTAAFTTVVSYPKLANGIMLDLFADRLVWIDNNKLVYSLQMIWLGGGDQTVSEVYDLNTDTRIAIMLKNLIPQNLFTFGGRNQPAYLIGHSNDDTVNVYSTDSSFKMLLSLPAMYATYNARNPDRVIIYPINNSMTQEEQATILDSDLHQTPIQISQIIPSDEWFIGIAP